jgi:hypothetical protein
MLLPPRNLYLQQPASPSPTPIDDVPSLDDGRPICRRPSPAFQPTRPPIRGDRLRPIRGDLPYRHQPIVRR